MKHDCTPLFRLVRLFALAAALSLAVAHADEYSDVSQMLRVGKLAEAQARVDRYLAAKPRDPQMRFMKGVIQRDTGRLADAIITFTRLTEDYPELPEPYNNLAVIHASLGQNEKARAALEMAIRTNPSYATAHENLGDVYAKLASQAYNKALQMDSTNAAAQPKLVLIRELFNPAVAGQRAAPAPSPTVQAAVTPPAKPPAPMPPAPAAAKPTVTATAQPAPASSATPAAAPKATATLQAAPADGPAREVEAAVRAWAKAWADKNMGGYLGAYGQDFAPPGQLSRSAWEQERRLRITGKSRISVNLLNLSVTINGNRAVAKFRQDYKADSLAVLSRKTLELVKTGNRWMIVKETSGT